MGSLVRAPLPWLGEEMPSLSGSEDIIAMDTFQADRGSKFDPCLDIYTIFSSFVNDLPLTAYLAM